MLSLFRLAKVEKDVAPGNGTRIYREGLALDYLGKYTGANMFTGIPIFGIITSLTK